MLNAYLTQTQLLLKDPNNQFYNTSNLTSWINIGRNTIATQSECLISNGSISTVNGTQSYGMAAIVPPSAGLSSAINVRSIRSVVGGQGAILEGRSWQYFLNFYLTGSNTIATGVPTLWAMQNQGSQGTIWFWAIPNGTVNMVVEASWVPVALTSDSTPEALSYPWTDAVPYFAAYLGLTYAQRTADAKRMLDLFNAFMVAARVGVTPETVPLDFPRPKPGGEGSLAQ